MSIDRKRNDQLAVLLLYCDAVQSRRWVSRRYQSTTRRWDDPSGSMFRRNGIVDAMLTGG